MKALILVRGEQKENSFGHYTAEILRTEGFNWYQVEELGSQDAAYLSGFELVILTRCFVGRAEIERLLDYVRGGGRLICFRPCLRLAQALGLEPTYAAQKGGTLRLSGAHGAGQGLGERSIQVHGMAEHWKVPAGSPLAVGAWLAEEPSGLSQHPALLLGPCGAGQVAIFSYDLAGTVAVIRQGDPARSNSLSLGLSGLYKPNELFVGHTDAVCAQIPQADVHSALLAEVIEALTRHPMPRLWYYARPDQRSVIVLTSDDDWSAVTDFEAFVAAAEAHGGHATFFLVPGSAITRELAEEWAGRGHAFGVHPDYRALANEAQDMGAQGIDEQYWTLKEMLRASVRGFEERFGVPVRTTRHHALRWAGYVEAARTLHDLGVQMEFNYYLLHPVCQAVHGRVSCHSARTQDTDPDRRRVAGFHAGPLQRRVRGYRVERLDAALRAASRGTGYSGTHRHGAAGRAHGPSGCRGWVSARLGGGAALGTPVRTLAPGGAQAGAHRADGFRHSVAGGARCTHDTSV